MRKNAKTTKLGWEDPDDAPEWSKEVFDRAEVRDGDQILRRASGTLTKRGRPKLENPKKLVTLRLDSEVLERFRDSGPGWQSRINDILRKAVEA